MGRGIALWRGPTPCWSIARCILCSSVNFDGQVVCEKHQQEHNPDGLPRPHFVWHSACHHGLGTWVTYRDQRCSQMRRFLALSTLVCGA